MLNRKDPRREEGYLAPHRQVFCFFRFLVSYSFPQCICSFLIPRVKIKLPMSYDGGPPTRPTPQWYSSCSHKSCQFIVSYYLFCTHSFRNVAQAGSFEFWPTSHFEAPTWTLEGVRWGFVSMFDWALIKLLKFGCTQKYWFK